MPQNATWNQFSAGWIPSDDSINGRKDGLLSMDNLELDRNGALTLIGGTSIAASLGASQAHTLYSSIDYLDVVNYYAATNGGVIYKNNIQLVTGGDLRNAAFGSAFSYTMMASGSKRLKEDQYGNLYNLGINIPSGPPIPIIGGVWKTSGFTQNTAPDTFQGVAGTWTINGSGFDVAPGSNTGVNNIPIVEGVRLSNPLDLSTLAAHPYSGGIISNSSANSTDNDLFILQIQSPALNNFTLVSVEVDIFLQPPPYPYNGLPTDYYTGIWTNATESGNGSVYAVQIPRSSFNRVGNGVFDWNTCYGYRIIITLSPLPDGTATYGDFTVSFPYGIGFIGGDAALSGAYQYAQINVRSDGSYLGKSQLGPLSTSLNIQETPDIFSSDYLSQNSATTPIPLASLFGSIQIYNPSHSDSQATETWLFRRGGNLDQWYRVGVITSAMFFGNSSILWNDLLSDEDALILDITINLNLVSIAASGITDKIYDILGPIEGRWFYFTNNTMYPSDINNPDLVDPSLAVKTTGTTEIYFWARKVAQAAVLVGTSRDVYILTGTFQTLPDNTVDIYYRPLVCAFPPRTYDAAFYNGSVYYLGADGWRGISAGGENFSLVVPSTDRLYRNISCYNYAPANMVGTGGVNAQRFPCVVAKNKLWVGVFPSTTLGRFEVYDFSRKYWRSFNINNAIGSNSLTAMGTTPNNDIIAAFTDGKIRLLDQQSTDLLIDGTTKQLVRILSPVIDGSAPRNRKDLYTLKIRLMGSSDPLTITLITEDGTNYNLGTITPASSTVSQEEYLDIAHTITGPKKTWQFLLSGTFSNLTINDMGVDYDQRPYPLTYLNIYNNNYGNAAKKRIRVMPFVIDTLGNNITFTPYVDGAPYTPTIINTNGKTTVRTFFKTDVFGVDYGGIFSGGLFEFWEQLPPDVVQTLPIARQFDQVGPQEFFRYGKIKQFELRVLSFGGVFGTTSTIPYTIYFNDNTNNAGTITVNNAVEASYYIGVPKGTSGNIVRIELGPTNFDFHRYYIRVQVQQTGSDTENQWVTITNG